MNEEEAAREFIAREFSRVRAERLAYSKELETQRPQVIMLDRSYVSLNGVKFRLIGARYGHGKPIAFQLTEAGREQFRRNCDIHGSTAPHLIEFAEELDWTFEVDEMDEEDAELFNDLKELRASVLENIQMLLGRCPEGHEDTYTLEYGDIDEEFMADYHFEKGWKLLMCNVCEDFWQIQTVDILEA